MFHTMIIKYLSKSQEKNLPFNMTNDTVVHVWMKNEYRTSFHAQDIDFFQRLRDATKLAVVHKF